ncbi:hypothetical protein YC2023_077622 [Brassica napus]
MSSPPTATATAVATALAPGFRFHPTDDELVSYYLKRKVLAKSCRIIYDVLGANQYISQFVVISDLEYVAMIDGKKIIMFPLHPDLSSK